LTHQISYGGFEAKEAGINLAVLAHIGKWHGSQKWCIRVKGKTKLERGINSGWWSPVGV